MCYTTIPPYYTVTRVFHSTRELAIYTYNRNLFPFVLLTCWMRRSGGATKSGEFFATSFSYWHVLRNYWYIAHLCLLADSTYSSDAYIYVLTYSVLRKGEDMAKDIGKICAKSWNGITEVGSALEKPALSFWSIMHIDNYSLRCMLICRKVCMYYVFSNEVKTNYLYSVN